jgi:hypothetical protein
MAFGTETIPPENIRKNIGTEVADVGETINRRATGIYASRHLGLTSREDIVLLKE